MKNTVHTLLLVAIMLMTTQFVAAQATLNLSGGSDPEDPTMIAFEKTEYDLGTFKAGEVVHAVFKFKNAGDANLVIEMVKPSCTCTKLEWTQGVIKPGGGGEVVADIDTAEKEGEQTKYFTVIYNGNPPVERVTLKFLVAAPDGAAEQGTTDGEDIK